MSIAIMDNGTARLVEGDEEVATLRALLVEARLRVAESDAIVRRQQVALARVIEVERENRDLRKRLGAARLATSNLFSALGLPEQAAIQRELMAEEVAA